jgi:hypothetical protein
MRLRRSVVAAGFVAMAGGTMVAQASSFTATSTEVTSLRIPVEPTELRPVPEPPTCDGCVDDLEAGGSVDDLEAGGSVDDLEAGGTVEGSVPPPAHAEDGGDHGHVTHEAPTADPTVWQGAS